MLSHDVSQSVLLFWREMRRVALAKHEQALVPEDGQRAGRVRVGESDEVEYERVEHFVRERVLLVQQNTDEERGRPYRTVPVTWGTISVMRGRKGGESAHQSSPCLRAG